MYQKELNPLKKANQFHQHKIWDKNLIYFASNDYLGLANDKKKLQKVLIVVNKYKNHEPKANMLVRDISEELELT